MPDLVHVRRALISVSDKHALPDLARGLADLNIEIISTGGTARALRDHAIDTIEASTLTAFPEMMDGRVKTLHPRIHAAILARRDAHAGELLAHDIPPIDLVCVNLYPFERTIEPPPGSPEPTLEEAIEQIDIGGPSLIRSAAKNHAWVVVLTSPRQYTPFLESLRAHAGATPMSLRASLAAEAFARTSAYDAAIAEYLTRAAEDSDPSSPDRERFPSDLVLRARRVSPLRYGENPHQPAALYRTRPDVLPSIVHGEQLHGKELSYNNILDADAALALVHALHRVFPDRVGACVVKHTNPCGVAVADSPARAVDAAIAGDPLASFGGILALNRAVDPAAAARIARDDAFFEVVLAPSFDPGALDTLRARWKNVRLLACAGLDRERPDAAEHPQARARSTPLQVRSIAGGLLLQASDAHLPHPAEWRHVAGPAPSPQDLQTAALLELAARALTSNAVAIGGVEAKSHDPGSENPPIRLFGAGAGQMDRIAACRIAIAKAGEHARGAIAVSDAFFPFSDGPALLADAGVRMIVHPGGSIRDQDTIDLCAASGITCCLTGVRRFRH